MRQLCCVMTLMHSYMMSEDSLFLSMYFIATFETILYLHLFCYRSLVIVERFSQKLIESRQQ